MVDESIDQLITIGFNKQNLILCEGITDKDFFEILIQRNSELNPFKDQFQIESFSGVETFTREYVKTIRVTPGFKNIRKILIVADFDDGLKNRFDSIRNALSKNNLPSPDKLGIWSEDSPGIQIYLFPNNKGTGMLETLCRNSIGDTELQKCVSRYEECIEGTGVKIKNPDKMRMFSFIAAHSRSCNVGVAAKVKIIDVTSETFSDIRRVLLEMIEG